MNYQVLIGLEIHVQLKTKSKMFCRCRVDFDLGKPNTNICPICTGQPGVLPKLNQKAILFTVKTALALGFEIAPDSHFDRKNYFYPDLPKGYQISQYEMPITKETGELSGVKIRRIHLEEDAAKLIHGGQIGLSDDLALVDFNRCGTPLMEIVTEPDITSSAQAKEFIRELQAIVRILGVSDADMEKGQLRCDANVNLKMGDQKTPIVEIKNMNSPKMVEKALNYEIKRQTEAVESGEKLIHETRGFDEKKNQTTSQRSKEEAPDYRYFPEPDLPPLKIHALWDIEQLKKDLPSLPSAKFKEYVSKYNLEEHQAKLLANSKNLTDYFEQVNSQINSPKILASWMIDEKMQDLLDLERMAEFIKLIQEKTISGKIAKEIKPELLKTSKTPSELIKEKGLVQIDQKEDLQKIIDLIIKNNSQPVADYQAGKIAALGFLVGQVMKESRGQARPDLVSQLIKERLA